MIKWVGIRKAPGAAALIGLSLMVLTGCAGSSVGDSVQRSLEADSQLAENPPFGDGAGGSTPSPAPTSTATPAAGSDSGNSTERDPARGTAPTSDRGSTASTPETPQSGDSSASTDTASTATNRAIQQAPAELRQYMADLVALDLLKLPAAQADGKSQIQPNATINRGNYAQWLIIVNNRFYQDQPSKQVRPGVASDQPAFQDVPPSHPNFAAIQGLAEAGLIPSALTGNSTAINFRPSDPLTRQNLILWKVPLDTRAALPTATVEAVQEAWGFQDAAKIDPLALRAVLADYQNGEFSNIRRAFGFTTLLQPDKAVTQAEAAAILWRFGSQTEGITAAQVRQGNTAPAPQNGGKTAEPN